jgi:predicted nucleic acid-binding protein
MIYFFDTSALQHRYLNGPKSRGIRWIISNRRNSCYIADLSVLEISSALALHCRRNSLPLRRYIHLDQAFWRDISNGRLVIRDTGQRDYLRARDLLRYAGVERKRHIKSADALIAASCLEFALGQSDPVTFCLEDWPLFHVLRDVSAYARVLRFHFIGIDKSKGAT